VSLKGRGAARPWNARASGRQAAHPAGGRWQIRAKGTPVDAATFTRARRGGVVTRVVRAAGPFRRSCRTPRGHSLLNCQTACAGRTPMSSH
jgi:hypothetical protein